MRERIKIEGWSWAINKNHDQTTMHAVKLVDNVMVPACGSVVYALTGVEKRWPQYGNVCLKCQHIVIEKGPDYDLAGYPTERSEMEIEI